MKKAKEYARIWNESPTTETLAKITKSFCDEILELAEMRSAKSNDAMLSIFDEQNQKWRAFSNRANGIRPEGFEMIVNEMFPEMAHLWPRRRHSTLTRIW